jgi:hypothetical protein
MSSRNLFAYAPNEVLTVAEFRGINAVRPGPVPTILINVALAEHILEYSKWGSGRLDWYYVLQTRVPSDDCTVFQLFQNIIGKVVVLVTKEVIYTRLLFNTTRTASALESHLVKTILLGSLWRPSSTSMRCSSSSTGSRTTGPVGAGLLCSSCARWLYVDVVRNQHFQKQCIRAWLSFS